MEKVKTKTFSFIEGDFEPTDEHANKKLEQKLSYANKIGAGEIIEKKDIRISC
jgi:hypothetical protein